MIHINIIIERTYFTQLGLSLIFLITFFKNMNLTRKSTLRDQSIANVHNLSRISE